MFRNNLSKMVFGIFLSISSLFAIEQSNYSVAVELARAEKVDSLVKKTNELQEYLKIYVYNTGDSTPTITEINNYSGVNLGSTAWQNYDGDQLTLTINTTVSATFGNLFTAAPSTEVLTFLVNSSNLDPLANVDTTNYSMTIPFSATLSSFLKATKELEGNSDVIISPTEPTDTSKTWYKPNGYGGYDIYGYNNVELEWQRYGSIGFDSDGGSGNNSNIVVKSVEELNSIPAVAGNKAYVSDGTKATEYVYDGEKWVKSSSSSDGGLFNGDGTILDMATSLLSKAGGSTVSSSDAYSTGVKNTFAGVKDFVKKDNTSTNGYWVDTTNSFVVAGEMNDLLTQNWANGTFAFLPNSTKDKVYVLQRINNKWWYVADNYDDVVLNMNDAKTYRVFDKTNNQYFKYSIADFWYSVTVTESPDYVSSLTSSTNGRSVFSSLNSTTVYYVLNNDCSSTNCNGLVGTNYYAGQKVNNMYVFYYALDGKRKNNLIDAIPRDTISDMYSNGDTASILKSTGELYFKDTDSRGRVIYRKSDGTFYSKAGVQIPSTLIQSGKANLPPNNNYSAEYVSISSNSINFGTNLNHLDEWTDAPNGAKVILSSTTYTHIKNSSYDFWTTNTSNGGVANNSTIYGVSRLTVPPIPNDTIKVYTKQLCRDDANCAKNNGIEDRYTDNGVLSTDSLFNGKPQWFYSLTGSNLINNLLDGLPVNAKFGDENFDDVVYSTYNELNLNIVYVDSNGLATSINQKGLKKYCYIYNVSNPNNTHCSTAYNTTNKMDNGYEYRIWWKSGLKHLNGWKYAYSGCTMEYAPGFSSSYYTIPSCNNWGTSTWYR